MTNTGSKSLRRLGQAVSGAARAFQEPVPRNQTIEIQRIRRDAELQCRASVDPAVIDEYALLMRAGVVFPPVRVWFDDKCYWLVDGFQRIAAAENEGRLEFAAEVRNGTLADARWDSYASNSSHGLRRTKTDIEIAIKRALSHPNASLMSNVQVAKHLGIPETTLRRWRKRLLPSVDQFRRVARGSEEYTMNINAIGHRKAAGKLKCHRDLEKELSEMKLKASSDARSILNIIGNWAFGASNASDCLAALNRLVQRWSRIY